MRADQEFLFEQEEAMEDQPPSKHLCLHALEGLFKGPFKKRRGEIGCFNLVGPLTGGQIGCFKLLTFKIRGPNLFRRDKTIGSYSLWTFKPYIFPPLEGFIRPCASVGATSPTSRS